MGLLIDGKWRDKWYDTDSTGGRFEREASKFHHWITADGSAGPKGEDGFQAEPGRYHLYLSHACPWSHRTMVYRAIKKLEDLVSLTVTHWHMGENGWELREESGAKAASLPDAKYIYEIYQAADSDYSGRTSVPVLWDKKRHTIVNNESSDIIRMFNTAFDSVGAAKGNYYPRELRDEIDSLNERIYETVNNGVYKAGFATTQQAYEEAIEPLFESLDWLNKRLSECRFLTGDRVTEADWRLFPTLVRFDPVYHGHFKCNIRRLVDYPNLWAYTCDLFQQPGIADTVRLDHIKPHYYVSHKTINPSGIVPAGPEINFGETQSRHKLAA